MVKLKIFGKSLHQYALAAWKFFTVVMILQIISVLWRLSGYDPSIMQWLLPVLLIIVILGGWMAVRRHGFDLVHTAWMGFFLSFSTHWALPLFHPAGEALYFFTVNSILFGVLTAFGGWLAKIVRK